jgi:hypothetical protein
VHTLISAICQNQPFSESSDSFFPSNFLTVLEIHRLFQPKYLFSTRTQNFVPINTIHSFSFSLYLSSFHLPLRDFRIPPILTSPSISDVDQFCLTLPIPHPMPSALLCTLRMSIPIKLPSIHLISIKLLLSHLTISPTSVHHLMLLPAPPFRSMWVNQEW